MTKFKLEKQLKEDSGIMEEYLYRDGEVPPVLFFHFPKINKKISNMMNKVPAGKLDVKNGFFMSLNDQVLMENRAMFLHHMGTIIATMELLNVLEAPESVVLCAEGWASEVSEVKKGVRPSKDPKAKDVFIINALSKDGEMVVDVKEKRLKMVKIKGKKAIQPELIEMLDKTSGLTSAPLLEAFFESYNASLVKLRADKGYEMFQSMAENDPVDAFRQGIEAAIIMTKMHAVRS